MDWRPPYDDGVLGHGFAPGLGIALKVDALLDGMLASGLMKDYVTVLALRSSQPAHHPERLPGMDQEPHLQGRY